MRVVAWHNRHPLARRIYPTQVHSIGEVLLPFASSMAAPAAGLSALGLPTVGDLLDPPQAAALAGFDADAGADTHADTDADKPTPEAPTERRDAESPALADTSAPDPSDAGASPFALAEADLAAFTAEAAQPTPAEPGPQDPAPHADLSLPLDPPDAPNPAAQPAAKPESPAAAAQAQPSTSAFVAALAALAARSASLPASPPVAAVGRLLQRLLARLPGRGPALPRLQAVFSRDFIWPLSPRRVARWARRHGQLQPLAPPDWPRRVVEADSAMLAAARQKGLGQSVALHLLTAAVGVGDRRLRLLMAADGHIIGPRAYSPPRLAAAGTLLALALLGAGWTWLRPPADNAATALAAAGAASSASAVASAASASASAASAVLVGASAVEPAASATVLDPAPAATAPAATPTPAAQAAAPSPAGVGAPAPLGRIRPTLSDEDKQAARAQTAALRSGNPTVTAPTLPTAPTGSTAAAAPAKVYALVSPPNPQRESANNVLAAMRRASGRLTPPVPEYTELMQDQGHWRAAWWPFVSLADAERARVMLASKGIKVEVVEF